MVERSAEDPCFIMYTGGTTGWPKGAILTNKNMLANVEQFAVWVNMERGKEKILLAFPMFHVAGTLVGCTTLYLAGEQTLIPNPRDLKHLVKEWIDLEPTWGACHPLYIPCSSMRNLSVNWTFHP